MDCNKTTNFLAELQRLCDSRDRCIANAADKEQCPMFGFCEEALTKICVEDAIKLVEAIKSGATNTRRKHTHRTSLRSFQKRRAIQTESRMYADKQHTEESVRDQNAKSTIIRELAIDAGTNL